MSASLVGSEMCIRDSDRSKSCNRTGPWDAPELPPMAPRPCRLPPPRAWSCLLYTSDAADDM
eukprot:15248313-Alexandrium_andersonii.AAC.1